MDWWTVFLFWLLGLFLIGGTSVVGNDFVEWRVEFCVFFRFVKRNKANTSFNDQRPMVWVEATDNCQPILQIKQSANIRVDLSRFQCFCLRFHPFPFTVQSISIPFDHGREAASHGSAICCCSKSSRQKRNDKRFVFAQLRHRTTKRKWRPNLNDYSNGNEQKLKFKLSGKLKQTTSHQDSHLLLCMVPEQGTRWLIRPLGSQGIATLDSIDQ